MSRRLKELEAAGLVQRIPDPTTGAADYIHTEKAIRLEPALNALAEWAQCNIDAEISLSNADISALMWAVRPKIVALGLPNRRTVIRFHFNDDPRPEYPLYWLLAESGAAMLELCAYDPGLDVDLFVETSGMSLGAILTGRSNIYAVIERGSLFLSGDASLVRTLDRWFRRFMYASYESIAKLPADVAPIASSRAALKIA